MGWLGTPTWDIQMGRLDQDAQRLPALAEKKERVKELLLFREKFWNVTVFKTTEDLDDLAEKIKQIDSEVRDYMKKNESLAPQEQQKLSGWYGVMPSELRKRWSDGAQRFTESLRKEIYALTEKMRLALAVLPSSVRAEGSQYMRFRNDAAQLTGRLERMEERSMFEKEQLFTNESAIPPLDEILQRIRKEELAKMGNALNDLREAYFKHADFGNSLWSVKLLIFTALISIVSLVVTVLTYNKKESVFLNTESPIQVEVQR